MKASSDAERGKTRSTPVEDLRVRYSHFNALQETKKLKKLNRALWRKR